MIETVRERRLNMDTLRQRLRQIGSGSEAPAARPDAQAAGGAPMPATALQGVLGGEEIEGCHVVVRKYDADHVHAGVPLRALWECCGDSLSLLARSDTLRDFDFRRAIFLDTETNGLAGGAGTYAFLVGVAYWEDDCFYVKQIFMRHPGEEKSLLAHLYPLFERYSAFVTFNGKSFDLPVLETRFVLARQPHRLRARPHLDLLHPARRLWRLRLESCSLGSLEQRILGAQRSEVDVPGYLIPQLYSNFLRDGDARPMKGIFYHNHQDLLALASLAVTMERLCRDPEQHALPHGQDLFSLARLYEDNGMALEAERCYRRALLTSLPHTLRREVLRRLSFLLKKQGKWSEAVEIWRSMVDQGELYPYLELAKYHEHQTHNYAAAERAVLAALQSRLRLTPSDYDELHHRLARVRRKQVRMDGEGQSA